MVNFLLSRNANPNLRTNDGSTPLHFALKWGNKRIIQIILGSCETANVVDNLGRSPLHHAALRDLGIDEIDESIIKNFDINHQDYEKMTPLHLACKAGKTALVELLISKGANTVVGFP